MGTTAKRYETVSNLYISPLYDTAVGMSIERIFVFLYPTFLFGR